ncbi:hypothetical protein SGRIM128S_04469 [Streptomyces griseomycini]
MAVKAPDPATTKLPDITASPGRLTTGSASPVSNDSSTSRFSAVVTVPSTTILSPWPRSMTSSMTISEALSVTHCPSRQTRGRLSPTIASWSRVRLARTSWTMPISVLARMTPPNNPSCTGPTIMMMTNSTPMIALMRVKRLLRTISPMLRLERIGTSLTRPAATRSAT